MSHSFPLHHFLLSPRPCSSCAVHSSFGSLSSDSFLSLSDLANSPSFLSLRLVAFVPYLFQPPPIFSIHSTSLARSTSLSLSLRPILHASDPSFGLLELEISSAIQISSISPTQFPWTRLDTPISTYHVFRKPVPSLLRPKKKKIILTTASSSFVTAPRMPITRW